MTTLDDLRQTRTDWERRHGAALAAALQRLSILERVVERCVDDETAIHALSKSEAEAVVAAAMSGVACGWRLRADNAIQLQSAETN